MEKTTFTYQEAIVIVQQYYPQVKVASHQFNKRGRHEMILRMSSSFIVEGSNFRTLAFNPGEKTCLAEMTDEKLLQLKSEMEGTTMPKTAIELITIERMEQIYKHGRSVEYDVQHNSERLQLLDGALWLIGTTPGAVQPPVGWDKAIWDKMMAKPYKERLVIAAALLAAEVDRIIATEDK